MDLSTLILGMGVFFLLIIGAIFLAAARARGRRGTRRIDRPSQNTDSNEDQRSSQRTDA